MKPEQVRIVIHRPDGGTSYATFVTKSYRPGGAINFEREPTRENVEAFFAQLNVQWVSWRIIAFADEPTDRTYRDAREDFGDRIGHDMAKAREIHRENLRTTRAPRLAALDVEYQRADEAEDRNAKRAVAARKQALRDVTKDPRIEAAQTITELKAVALPDAESAGT